MGKNERFENSASLTESLIFAYPNRFLLVHFMKELEYIIISLAKKEVSY